jgi:hypothetical protein
MGQNFGNNAGNTMMQAGNARGSGYIGKSNAITNALSNIGNSWQDADLYSRYGYRPPGG